MRTRTATARNQKDLYLELVRALPLRPLRSEAEYDRANQVLIKLFARGEKNLKPGELDYLEALSRFVRDYDEKHYPMEFDRGTPLERLRYLMQESGMTVTGLGRILGSQPAASMVLSGKRQLSKTHIRKLAEYFKLNPGYFM